ncbi:MAG: O-acetyl-ADP-ribose deacetylase [Candidatus Cloacimonetes bacterium]|nr:O-acetyl-ADP-ribose deacetylase [Candidatus Cloacimonadota bacterium]
MSARIELLKGDITRCGTDAIVNAANNSLLGGGGVDGAIHRAAGPELFTYNKKLHGCETGQAKISPGFWLLAKHVISTVGPVWQGGDNNEDALLANCYSNCLKLARENRLKSIAFPAISTGVYAFPIERAAAIAVKTVRDVTAINPEIQRVVFVCFNDKAMEVYKELLG